MLTSCIFAAYIILMKIFMTYHNQIIEAKEKRRLRREKAKAKALEKQLSADNLKTGDKDTAENKDEQGIT